MWTVHRRLAELWFKHSYVGPLSQQEAEELRICMDANMNKAAKLARLENLSFVAYTVSDTEWQHEICAKIEELSEGMGYKFIR